MNPAAAALGAALLVLAGCGGDNASDATGTATDTGLPAPTATGDPAPITALSASMVLTSEEMPVWNGAISWPEDDAVTPELARPLCDLPDWRELGAIDVVSIGYRTMLADPALAAPEPDHSMMGTHEVALFADPAAARAAQEALTDALSACWPESDGDACEDCAITTAADYSTWIGSRPCVSSDLYSCADGDQRFEHVGVASADNAVSLLAFEVSAMEATWCQPTPRTEELDCEERDPVLRALQASVEQLRAES